MAKVALVEAAPPEDELDAPKKKGGKGKIIILAVAVLVLGGGGFAGWKLFAGHGADEHAAEKAAADTPPVFLPVDQFTVNLNPEGGEQFLQTAFSLKVTDQEVVDALKARAPELRNQVLLLLSSKKASELTTVEGKQKLAAQLVTVANDTITPAFPALKKAAEAKAAADAKKAAADKAAKDAKATDADAADKDKTGEKAADSDGEDKPEPKAAAKEGKAAKKDKDGESGKAATPAHAVLDVLFTHFIIQ